MVGSLTIMSPQVICVSTLMLMLPNCCVGQYMMRPVYFPDSKADLKSVIQACLALSRTGYCPNGKHGPVERWDVSDITDMNAIFMDATWFNGDISEWDVSRVKDMGQMFTYARHFNQYGYHVYECSIVFSAALRSCLGQFKRNQGPHV